MQPTTVSEIQSFWDLVGYYRRFVQNFSKIVAPLSELTRKREPFIWMEKHEWGFQELKKRLTTIPILVLLQGTEGFFAYNNVSH